MMPCIVTILDRKLIWVFTTIQTFYYNQFWILSGHGAFIGAQLCKTSLTKSSLMWVRSGGSCGLGKASLLYVGNVKSAVSSRLHGAVATHVVWKRSSAFSWFYSQILPSFVINVCISCEGFSPMANFFALKRLSWVSSERNERHLFVFWYLTA